jgi:hypothetical protein
MSSIQPDTIDLTGDDDDEIICTGSKRPSVQEKSLVPVPSRTAKKPRVERAAAPESSNQATAGPSSPTLSLTGNLNEDNNVVGHGPGQVRLYLACEFCDRCGLLLIRI